MRLRSRVSSLVLVLFGALALGGCGEIPLDELPDDVTAVVQVEIGDGFAFASIRLVNESCLQLPNDTSMSFNGADGDPVGVFLGGRGGTPLAAYLTVECEPPNAFWNTVEAFDPPFVFEVSSGDTTLLVELSDPEEVARCDFPACATESFGPDVRERVP